MRSKNKGKGRLSNIGILSRGNIKRVKRIKLRDCGCDTMNNKRIGYQVYKDWLEGWHKEIERQEKGRKLFLDYFWPLWKRFVVRYCEERQNDYSEKRFELLKKKIEERIEMDKTRGGNYGDCFFQPF